MEKHEIGLFLSYETVWEWEISRIKNAFENAQWYFKKRLDAESINSLGETVIIFQHCHFLELQTSCNITPVS